MDLTKLGWNLVLQEQFTTFAEQGYVVGRVATEYTHIYQIYTQEHELLAEVSGKMRFQASERADFPAVGDWVAITVHGEKALIHAILPRKSKFSRKVAGAVPEEQIVAANVDYIFIVNSLNNDFNLRRIERYLMLTWESGATPIILLSKADLCNDVAQRIAEVQSIALDVPIYAISSIRNEGLSALEPYLQEGKTAAVLGSSGVGKSTLINCIIGEEVQRVNEIRQGDDRGKHTTTHRELILLPNGGIIIDTPGMRELQLWGTDEGLSNTFEDIETLAADCFFKDCRHRKEPGCAVKAAVENGTLDSKRLYGYHYMMNEISRLSYKVQGAVRSAENQSGKKGIRRVIDKERGRSDAKRKKSNSKFHRGFKKGL